MISRKLVERILVCLIVLLAIGFTGAAIPVALKVTTETGLVRFAAQENVQQLRVEILTLTGQNVFDSGVLQGARELVWQMQNKLGFRIASGIYLYKVSITDASGNSSQRFGKLPVLTPIKGPTMALDLTLPSLDSIARANAATPTNLCRVPTGRYWCLTGNSATDPARHFLGTVDEAAFEIRVNNQRALRIGPATTPNLIGGFSGNTVSANVKGAVIAGGGRSSNANEANHVLGDFGVIGGGYQNSVDANSVVVGGVANNSIKSSFVGAGNSNRARGDVSVIVGGLSNSVNGAFSVIPGGINNVANGHLSFAAGLRAYANHNGSFVWADCINDTHCETSIGEAACDPSSPPCFKSTQANQFSVRATGGFRFVTSIDASGNPATGCNLPSGSGTFSCTSDRNAKTHFVSVNSRGILAKLAAIPISTWSYKSQKESIRHIGPMAQDFYTAFQLGEDEKHISTIDADGIALISIQALYELSLEKDKKIEELQQRIEKLERIIGALTQH